jgi:hypothetical protein
MSFYDEVMVKNGAYLIEITTNVDTNKGQPIFVNFHYETWVSVISESENNK